MVGTRPIERPRAPLRLQRRAQLGDGAHGPHASASRPARARVRSTSSSKRGSRCGADSATASRWRSTVASSPRATGPVSAAAGPRSAQFSHRGCARAAPAARGPRSGSSPAPRRHLLGGGLERHQEVGGDRGGGVVGGAGRVVDLERRACRAPRRVACAVRQRVGRGARHRAAGAGEARGALAAGEGLQRVEAEGLGAGRVERGERRWRRSCARRAAPRRPRPRRRPGSRRRARTAAPRRRGAACSPRPAGPPTVDARGAAARRPARRRGGRRRRWRRARAARAGAVVGVSIFRSGP